MCYITRFYSYRTFCYFGTVFKRFCNLFRRFRWSGYCDCFGGVGPYNLLWSDGSTVNFVNTFAAGYHTLTVTDSFSCLFIDSVEILEPSQSIEIDSLIISEITCNITNNASITVLATGGQLPYVYSNTNGVFTQNGISFINLSPNQYIMYIRDSKGCIDRDTVVITQPDSLYIDTTIFSHITCNG